MVVARVCEGHAGLGKGLMEAKGHWVMWKSHPHSLFRKGPIMHI